MLRASCQKLMVRKISRNFKTATSNYSRANSVANPNSLFSRFSFANDARLKRSLSVLIFCQFLSISHFSIPPYSKYCLCADCFKANWPSHKNLHKAVQELLLKAKRKGEPTEGHESMRAGFNVNDRATWKSDVNLW